MKNLLVAAAVILLLAPRAFAAEPAANFSKLCVSCHGKDRKGAPAMVKMFKLEPAAMDLTSKDFLSLSEADIAATISAGKGKMPAHKTKLTAGEIAALAAYLKAPEAKAQESKAASDAKAAAAGDMKAPAAAADVKAPAATGDAKAPPAAPAKAAESADYKAKCVSCHGKDGKGNPAMAKMFKLDPSAMDLTAKSFGEKTDEAIAKLIADGKGKMPAFKAKLSDSQIKEVVKYLRALSTQEKP